MLSFVSRREAYTFELARNILSFSLQLLCLSLRSECWTGFFWCTCLWVNDPCSHISTTFAPTVVFRFPFSPLLKVVLHRLHIGCSIHQHHHQPHNPKSEGSMLLWRFGIIQQVSILKKKKVFIAQNRCGSTVALYHYKSSCRS